MAKNVEGEKWPPVEDFRLDPDVKPTCILYPSVNQVQSRLGKFQNLQQGKDKLTEPPKLGFLDKLKILFNPSLAIDRKNGARAAGFFIGQAEILGNFLGVVGQKEVNPTSLPVNMDFGPDYVTDLFDDYGYYLRLSLWGKAIHIESVYYLGLNPLSRIKQINNLPEAELKELAKGAVLGKFTILEDILVLLGQTSQTEQIFRNVGREIKNPVLFNEIVERKRTARLQKAMNNCIKAFNEFKNPFANPPSN